MFLKNRKPYPPPYPARQTPGENPATSARPEPRPPKPAAVRRQPPGGHHYPLPLAASFPLLEDKRRGLLPPLRYGRKPVHQGLKGGGTAPSPWSGAERKEKTRTSVSAFFPVTAAPAAPARKPPQKGALRPPGCAAYRTRSVPRPPAPLTSRCYPPPHTPLSRRNFPAMMLARHEAAISENCRYYRRCLSPHRPAKKCRDVWL
jgi:hypothetical protein